MPEIVTSLLKFWFLVSNCKFPNVFLLLFVIFLNFPRWNPPTFSQYIKSDGIRILNTKKVGFVQTVVFVCLFVCLFVCCCCCFLFLQIYVLYRWRKTGQIDVPEKRAPSKVKYLLPVCQILRNFTEGNARKFNVSFAFLCSCWHNKISKNTDVFLWARADYLLSARAVVKL